MSKWNKSSTSVSGELVLNEDYAYEYVSLFTTEQVYLGRTYMSSKVRNGRSPFSISGGVYEILCNKSIRFCAIPWSEIQKDMANISLCFIKKCWKETKRGSFFTVCDWRNQILTRACWIFTPMYSGKWRTGFRIWSLIFYWMF